MKAKEVIKRLKELGNKDVVITVDDKHITDIVDLITGRDDYDKEVIVLKGADDLTTN